jgi:hypothetical protein
VPPSVSIEDHTVVGLCVVETLLVLATYSGKPLPQFILNLKRQLCTGRMEMVGVPCNTLLRIHQGWMMQCSGYCAPG